MPKNWSRKCWGRRRLNRQQAKNNTILCMSVLTKRMTRRLTLMGYSRWTKCQTEKKLFPIRLRTCRHLHLKKFQGPMCFDVKIIVHQIGAQRVRSRGLNLVRIFRSITLEKIKRQFLKKMIKYLLIAPIKVIQIIIVPKVKKIGRRANNG